MDKESEIQRGLDWQQPRPTEAEIAQMWHDLQIKPLELDKDFLEYINKISESFTAMKLFSFEISINKNLDWFGSRNRLNEIDFLSNLIRHRDIVSSIRDIEPIDNFVFQYPIERLDGLRFDPELASLEIFGGAYHEYDKSNVIKPREDAFEAWKKFTEGRLLDFVIFETSEKWGEWFFNVHDKTYVIYDSLKRRVTLFALADTD